MTTNDKAKATGSGGTLSASEIARSLKLFKIWANLHGCEQTVFDGLPDELSTLVLNVFNVEGKIPSEWLKEDESPTPEIHKFLRVAYEECPKLFSSTVNQQLSPRLRRGISAVESSYGLLRRKRKHNGTWSESDFVNFCSMFRGHAIVRSEMRSQCKMSLPIGRAPSTPEERRVSHTSSIVPDCATFISPSQLTELSSLPSSPFKLLSKLSNDSPLAYQSTPCEKLPERDGFEFMSSVWEDKCISLEPAYRQNRMATAAAARQLAAFGIKLPVFGILWSEQSVKVHVDWCDGELDGEVPTVYSAPYPGPVHANVRLGKSKRSNLSADSAESAGYDNTEEISYNSSQQSRSNSQFHEWSLRKPSDILKVYLFLCNIDRWTAGPFRHAIVKRIRVLGQAAEYMKNLSASEAPERPLYRPWRRPFKVLSPVLTEKQTPDEQLSSSSSLGSVTRTVKVPNLTVTVHATEAEADSHLSKAKRKKKETKAVKGKGSEKKPKFKDENH